VVQWAGRRRLVWRGWLAIAVRPLPSRWWLLALLVLTVAATLFTFKTLLGRDAGVTLIVVLLALKTLELRAKRDAFVVFFLSFFTMPDQLFLLAIAAHGCGHAGGPAGLAHGAGQCPYASRKTTLAASRQNRRLDGAAGALPSWPCCSCCFPDWRRCGASPATP